MAPGQSRLADWKGHWCRGAGVGAECSGFGHWILHCGLKTVLSPWPHQGPAWLKEREDPAGGRGGD